MRERYVRMNTPPSVGCRMPYGLNRFALVEGGIYVKLCFRLMGGSVARACAHMPAES